MSEKYGWSPKIIGGLTRVQAQIYLDRLVLTKEEYARLEFVVDPDVEKRKAATAKRFAAKLKRAGLNWDYKP